MLIQVQILTTKLMTIEHIFFKSDSHGLDAVWSTDGKINFYKLSVLYGLEQGLIALYGDYFSEIYLKSKALWL